MDTDKSNITPDHEPSDSDIFDDECPRNKKEDIEFEEDKTDIGIAKGIKDECGGLYSEDGRIFLSYTDEKGRDEYAIKDGTEIIGEESFYDSNIHHVIIPESVIAINATAFCHCQRLDNIVIPSHTVIQKGAFCCNTSLRNIHLPVKLETLPYATFIHCHSLQQISIPSSVKEFGSSVFRHCWSLRSIEIPEGVEELTSYIFSDCPLLSTVILPSTIKRISSLTFFNTKNIKQIFIPKFTRDHYSMLLPTFKNKFIEV